MNLRKVFVIFDTIKRRLPKTYPKPRLAFFEDENCLLDNMRIERGNFSIYAVVDPDTYTINMPMRMSLKHTYGPNKKAILKSVPISKFSDKDIALTILHEYAHLYAGERYGWDSKQYFDEIYCDRFAERWYKKMKEEKLL
jgi:hypothetical protein